MTHVISCIRICFCTQQQICAVHIPRETGDMERSETLRRTEVNGSIAPKQKSQNSKLGELSCDMEARVLQVIVLSPRHTRIRSSDERSRSTETDNASETGEQTMMASMCAECRSSSIVPSKFPLSTALRRAGWSCNSSGFGPTQKTSPSACSGMSRSSAAPT